MARNSRSVVVASLLLFLVGCDSPRAQDDQRYQQCIDAGGSYRQPVEDGIGFACDMAGGRAQ